MQNRPRARTLRLERFLAAALLLGGALMIAAAPAPAGAATDRYVFDKDHTQILFFVDHLGFSMSQGEFHDYDGHFTFDPEDWGASAVDVTIRTHSIDMDDYAWDKHMRDEDFLWVDEHPEMRFVSERVERTGERTGKIHGTLTLRGVSQPVTLDVTFNKAGEHPINKKYVAGFSAETVVQRSDFGMDYGLPAVGDDVHIRLEVEGFRQ